MKPKIARSLVIISMIYKTQLLKLIKTLHNNIGEKLCKMRSKMITRVLRLRLMKWLKRQRVKMPIVKTSRVKIVTLVAITHLTKIVMKNDPNLITFHMANVELLVRKPPGKLYIKSPHNERDNN